MVNFYHLLSFLAEECIAPSIIAHSGKEVYGVKWKINLKTKLLANSNRGAIVVNQQRKTMLDVEKHYQFTYICRRE